MVGDTLYPLLMYKKDLFCTFAFLIFGICRFGGFIGRASKELHSLGGCKEVEKGVIWVFDTSMACFMTEKYPSYVGIKMIVYAILYLLATNTPKNGNF